MGKNKKRKNSVKVDTSEPTVKEAKITVTEPKIQGEGTVAATKNNVETNENEVVGITTEEKVEEVLEENEENGEEKVEEVLEDNEENKEEKVEEILEENEENREDSIESEEKETDVNEKSEKKKEKQATPKKYILFIGNLPFDANEEEIKAHFADCEEIKDLRLIKKEKTNVSKGFCYLELGNSNDFEKAFCKHHTTFQGRRINVELPKQNNGKQHKKGNKKSFKLQAMRDKGLLAGSVKKTNKRSFRREKKRKMENNKDKD